MVKLVDSELDIVPVVGSGNDSSKELAKLRRSNVALRNVNKERGKRISFLESKIAELHDEKREMELYVDTLVERAKHFEELYDNVLCELEDERSKTLWACFKERFILSW
jgi:hypothetical protein